MVQLNCGRTGIEVSLRDVEESLSEWGEDILLTTHCGLLHRRSPYVGETVCQSANSNDLQHRGFVVRDHDIQHAYITVSKYLA